MWSTSNPCGDRSSSRSRPNKTFAKSRSVTSTEAGFRGRLLPSDPHPPLNMRGELCSDPRAEVVEALRWARELLSRGNVSANDVAITTASPSVFDEHMLVLASQAGIPIHFSHGVPALSSFEGQSCAALADVAIVCAWGASRRVVTSRRSSAMSPLNACQPRRSMCRRRLSWNLMRSLSRIFLDCGSISETKRWTRLALRPR